MAKRDASGEWMWPPISEALEVAGLYPIREYIHRRQSTIATYIAERPIYKMCMEATRAPGAYHSRLNWWTQNHAADAPELEENQYDGSFDDDESLQATP